MKHEPRPIIDKVSQAKFIRTHRYSVMNKYGDETKLCNIMDCPKEDKHGSSVACNTCIGQDHTLGSLKKINPQLNESNLVQTVTAINLLLK